ncbi:MAG: serine/threonine protein kinase, partial [Planctomycetaceae bacterium]|nr:serine/threonine protein kinase [Planctomycetaceae bacterium]
MKLLCPKCSSECDVTEQGQSTLTCPSCGLALFVSTSIRGRLSSTRMGQVSELPEAPDRDGNRYSPLQQTVSFIGEVLPQAPELALVPQFLGRYEIVEFLGAGSFSRVYLAKDPQLGRLVALKVPKTERFDSPEDLATFLREARTIAGLDHPGIVSVYDVATESNGVQFIVMQYIPGMTLQDRMTSGPMTYVEAADFVCQVAEAIHTAHKRQVFHRDLKPANILVDSEGRPHVADFGLAVLEHQQQQHVGEVAGTLIYMAPEQIRGEAQWLDGRSDIWSLGAIFYSLLTGRHPFLGQGKKVTEEILHREPRPPRQINERIPKELERICLKCLTKPVRERYFSAFDLAEDLKTWLRTEALALAPSSGSAQFSDAAQTAADSVRQPPPTTRARRIALNIAGAAVLILGAIGANHFSKLNTQSDNSIVATVGGLPNKSRESPIAELLPKPTPFKLDSYAVPGRWYPLLEQEPQLFAVSQREMSKWTHDPKLQELLIDAPTTLYLDLGETQSKKFILEATIASRNWLGRIGLFWGRKAAPTAKPAEGDQTQYHVVFLDAEEYQGKRDSVLQRDWVTYRYDKAMDAGG